MTAPSASSPASASTWWERVRRHASRWWGSDFHSIRATDAERALLATPPLPFTDPAVQDYLAWRRSMALCTLALALVAVLHGVINAVPGDEPQAAILTLLDWAWVGSRVVLAFALLRATLGWADPRGTRRQLRWAWAIALLVPVLLLQLPLADLALSGEEPSAESGEGAAPWELQRDIAGTVVGVVAFLMAIPGLTSLFPGAIRAGLLVKTLLPGRSMGPVLATFLAPLYALLLLVLLTFFQQLGGSGFFLAGALLLFTGPMLTMRPGWALVRPQTHAEAAGPLKRYRFLSRACTLGGLLLVMIGLFTTRVFGLRILGTEHALMDPIDIVFLAIWFLTMLGAYTIVSADALLEGMTKADDLAVQAGASEQFRRDSVTLARLEAAVGLPAERRR